LIVDKAINRPIIKAIVNKNQQDFEVIVMLVRDALTSENSKRAYGKALNDFLDWYREQGQPRLSKAIVQRYKAELVEKGLSPATINLRMSAIRKLANEAADNGYLAQSLANGITKVRTSARFNLCSRYHYAKGS
jgi:site-specific recombinase XerD